MSIIRIATVFDLDTQDTWSCFMSTGIFKDWTFFVGPNQGPILDQFRFRMWTSGSSIQLGWNLDERRCCLRCAGLRQSTLALEGSCSCWSWGGSYTPSKTRKVKKRAKCYWIQSGLEIQTCSDFGWSSVFSLWSRPFKFGTNKTAKNFKNKTV